MKTLETRTARIGLAALAMVLLGGSAVAAQTKDQPPISLRAQNTRQLAAAAPASAPAPTAATPARPQAPQLSYMQLQAQYKGPLQDTVIQRWRDPIDGSICYVYLPVVVQHSPPTAGGAVQYGSNTIGSISCLAGKF